MGRFVPVADASRPPRARRPTLRVDTPQHHFRCFKYTLASRSACRSRLEESRFRWMGHGDGSFVIEWHPNRGPRAHMDALGDLWPCKLLESVTTSPSPAQVNKPTSCPPAHHRCSSISAAWSDPAIGQYGRSSLDIRFPHADTPHNGNRQGCFPPPEIGAHVDVRAELFHVVNRPGPPRLNGTKQRFLQPSQCGSNGLSPTVP